MCVAKTPKVTPQATKPPKPAIIRNPYLDGARDVQLGRQGRSSLRVDPGSTRATPLPSSPGPAGTPVDVRGNMQTSGLGNVMAPFFDGLIRSKLGIPRNAVRIPNAA